jgi:fatty-acyl-CoA synthase
MTYHLLQRGRCAVSWDLDWIEKRSQITPEKTAVIDKDSNHRWSYRELNQRAHSLACFLKEAGIEKGDRVALISPNDITYFDLFFACLKAGVIFVPLNWRLSASEIKMIIEDCQPSLVLFHSRFASMLEKAQKTIQIDHVPFERIFLQSNRFLPSEKVSEHDPLTIIYTGGTTGKSKGVVLTHSNIHWNAVNTIVSWNLTADDTTLTYLPMFHTGGLNALTVPVLVMGGTVLIAREFDAEHAIRIIEEEKCTVLLMVPTMYHLMIHTESFKLASFRHVKTFLSGGAPCPLLIYEAFSKKGIDFKEGYGLTEAGPNNFFIDPSVAQMRIGSVGRPMMYNKVKIMKADGTDALPEEVGELLIHGNHVFDHYWNNPEATKETIIDGWLYTGDLAKYDEEGFYYIVGRKKEMIITGGENVYPLEVEHCIQSHPAVSEVAVVGLPHPKWGETVAAFLAIHPNHQVTKEELYDYCLSRLGEYKIPKYFQLLEELPKTHVGKIDKKALQNDYQSIVR